MAISIQTLARDAFWSADRVGPRPHSATAFRATPEHQIELVTTRSGFEALEGEWNALFERAGRSTQLFQTFNWNWHWANAYVAADATNPFAIVTVRRGRQLVMIWPLVIDRPLGLRVLAWMGEPVSQYGDVLAEDGPLLLPLMREAYAVLCEAIRPDAVRLAKTRSDALVAPFLAEIGCAVTQWQEAPYLDLASAGSYEDYEKRHSADTRRNRRRQRRRLGEAGDVTFALQAEGRQAAQLAATAVAMKRAWLDTRGLVSPAVANPRFEAFFAAAAASTERPCGLRIAVMSCGAVPAAAEISIECKGRAAVHVLAYDMRFEKSAPGALLMEMTLAALFERGMATCDLMAPGGGYKRDWADKSVAVLDHARGITMRGAAYTRLYLAFARPRLKAAIEALPLSWRRTIGRRLRANDGMAP